MAIKTFSSGEVLTAADTNTYLTNGGLVYLKEQTVASGVPNVLVTSAFNSAYQNYKIIYTGGFATATTRVQMRLGIGATMTSTNYFGGSYFFNVGTGVWSVFNDNGTAQANNAGAGGGGGVYVNMDILQPQIAANTFFHGVWNQVANGRFGGMTYEQLSGTQFTSFTLYSEFGNFNGGTIYIYGYRKV